MGAIEGASVKILVTGAHGQLGGDLVPVLLGHDVVAIDVDELDITDHEAVLAFITDLGPERVINCAAMTAVDACETNEELAWSVNATGVQNLAEACGLVGAHLLTVSTDYVFDGTKTGPYVESDTPNPKSVYGRSKLAGEAAAGATATIVRTSWLSGEHGPNMVKTIVRLLSGDGQLRFVDDQVGCPTFAADLAPMVVRLAVDAVPGVFHVTNQGPVSWFELAREIAVAAGADPERVESCATADLQPPRPAPRPANSVLDSFNLRRLGYLELRHHLEPLEELVARLT